MLVAKSGMASVDQSRDTNASKARQLFFSGSCRHGAVMGQLVGWLVGWLVG